MLKVYHSLFCTNVVYINIETPDNISEELKSRTQTYNSSGDFDECLSHDSANQGVENSGT